ncbi:Aste57867_18179 [Aphanomyces stellatus]|uniref:Aste57867_18179 protein n=1 Tax=Aphanomyces stellatus TaxID=120398 RepID=A0A485L9F3_9STRA|nr:hypothetical protein As57867_018117 [Aphanomyces stellatus]VFT94917.1 Aste57867_18179 [Aphanomyces stellatus]
MGRRGLDAKKVKVTLTIEASLDESEFVNPTFRYRFLDGSKKTTPPVGAAGAWTAIASDGSLAIPTPAGSSGPPPGSAGGGKQPASARQGATAVNDTAVIPEGPKYFRHEQHVDNLDVTEAFATKLNENPLLVFFLADQSTTGATAVSTHNQPPGRNFISFFEVDASPLLGGDVVVEQQWGYEAAAKDEHLPLAAPMVNAHGIRSLLIRVKVDQPILSAALAKELNPLTLCLRKVTNLPGITVQSKPLLQYITPTPHAALHKCCVPTYASLRLPPLGPHRFVRTAGILQDAAIAWRHKTTFLCGTIPWLTLQEAFTSGHVLVEMHDRDVHVDAEYGALVHKWEAFVGGRVPDGEHKALEIFQVDEMAKQDIQKLYFVHAGDRNAHGQSTFRFYELLATTTLRDATSHRPFMQLKFTADVVQQKRRIPPKEGSDQDMNLSQIDKLVRLPGAYLNCLTSFAMDATLAHPLKPTEASNSGGLFARMVVVIPYGDVATLTNISRAIEAVNGGTLPGVPLRSYQLTPAQKDACENGSLNLITGFQVIDTHFRMIVMEGLAASGMLTVAAMVPRTAANSKSGFRMFANVDLRFPERLYTAFDVDLKRIKLRDPLPDIGKRPELYMRSKVSENCFQALNRLSDVRKADRLLELKDLDLFPTVRMLLEVESKYGESITLEDIHGHVDSSHHKMAHLASDEQTKSSSTIHTTMDVHVSSTAIRLKAPTDATNPAFDAAKKNWHPTDYVDLRRHESERVDLEYAASKANAPPVDPNEPVYIYSGQKLRTKDLEKDAMRQRLARDRHATYTYSKDFNSLTVSLVDETKLALLAEAESRAQWTTPSGFVYPMPRQPSEFYKHKDAPSAARCEDLHSPWVENLYHPQPLSRGDSDGADAHKTPFDILPSKDMVFGGTNTDGSVNAGYFKSVHLVGDGLAKEMEEAKAKEHQEWLYKLVVDRDNLRFIAHGDIMGQGRAKPSSLDKPCDILAGQVRSKPLRIVRNAKLPSGKHVPLQAMPVSIMDQDEYKGGAPQVIVRAKDTTQFLAKSMKGDPKDFLFPSLTQILVPQVNKHTTLLKPRKPMMEAEKTGLRWKNPNQDAR